jgi:uncharacterized NAD(P)/FAD-binding protein YdhS
MSAPKIEDLPAKIAFLRDLVEEAKANGPDWSQWTEGVRGNPIRVAQAIEQLEHQIAEGERIYERWVAI